VDAADRRPYLDLIRSRRSATATPDDHHNDQSDRSVSVMGIVSLLFLGLLAGALAKWLLPGDDPGGVLATMLIGVVGALLGGFLAGALFGADLLGGFFELSTWVTAVAGSIVLLVLYRLITRRRRTA
jgi:uncharacterized membrane protein YeaQ/YmgE (transglycosylase-associated protein family)